MYPYDFICNVFGSKEVVWSTEYLSCCWDPIKGTKCSSRRAWLEGSDFGTMYLGKNIIVHESRPDIHQFEENGSLWMVTDSVS